MPPYGKRRSTKVTINPDSFIDDNLKYGNKEDIEYPDKAHSNDVREYYRASSERANFLALTGSLVPQESVAKLFTEVATDIKKALLEMPERLASRLAAESQSEVIHQILFEEVQRVSRVVADKEKHVEESAADPL